MGCNQDIPMKYFLRNFEDRALAYYDRISGYSLEKKRFLKAHGYHLNLNEPKSFNEKICWKKINDRNPLLPIVADKYRVRSYVSEILKESSRDTLIPILQTANRAEDLTFEKLPNQFVIKSNHGSGHVLIVKDKSRITKKEIIDKTSDWLLHDHGYKKHEWAYNQFPRKLIVEKLILNNQQEVPEDYKFSMIHGQCAFIQVDRGRFDNFTRSIFNSNWEYLNVKWKRNKGEPLPKPENLELMLEIAQELSKPFDYIRVDLYSLDKGEVYFGELTNYPVSGRGKITPQEFDFELGKLWTLPTTNLVK